VSEVRNIRFTLNGRPVRAQVEAGESVVTMLSQRFELTGTRESCGQGLCGCCTVSVDGKVVSGCLHMAWFLDGTQVQTIEGLSDLGKPLDPVQDAFIEAGAFQCGFCTPGFIMMTKSLLKENPNPDDEEIRHYLAGNLCRCSAYPEIVRAIKLAASRAASANEKTLQASHD
jgi:aerobic-type carbon monoxide dehydrogenase small subunit (CoxS/CutS family)